MDNNQFTSPLARQKRETTFWQGVACGLAIAVAVLAVAWMRIV